MPRTEANLRTAIAALDRRWARSTKEFTENLRGGYAAVGLGRAVDAVERFIVASSAGEALPEIELDAAEGFVAILEAHPAARLASRGDVGLQLSLDEAGWSAALLTAGALALGQTGRTDKGLIDALVSVAMGGASQADLLTRFTLTGGNGIDFARHLRLDDNILDDLDGLLGRHSIVDLREAECLADLKAAAIGLVGAASSTPPRMPNISPVLGCNPNHGRPGAAVVLSGVGWPVTQPADVQVVFTSNMGTPVSAVVSAWGASQITVIVPPGVGVGPVGFLSVPSTAIGNATAGIAMADAIGNCIGAGGGQIADRLAHWVPPAALMIPPALEHSRGNRFIGGPQITAVQPFAIHEGDTVTISGHEFANGDRVQFDVISQSSTVLSATSLMAVVPALLGGRRTVRVTTPAIDLSNVLSVQVLPILTSLSQAQAKVGDSVEVKGSGFDRSTVVTLDGIPAVTNFIDSHTMRFTVRRPPVPFSRAVGGDIVQVQMRNPDGALAGPLPLLVLERIVVVFGDSIAWGQGLVTNQKFGDLVATHLQLLAGTRERIGASIYLAHSGAILGTAPTVGTLPSSGTLPGEVPAPLPSVHEQVTAAGSPAVLGNVAPNDIQNVIVVAGMNSIEIFNVLNPRVTHAMLASDSDKYCFTEMKRVLTRMVAQFPAAKIVVGGYYPIVSEQSDLNLLMAVLAGLGLVVIPAAPIIGTLLGPIGVAVSTVAAMIWAKGVVVSNCAFAATRIQADLTRAVEETNQATPGNARIAVAAIPWAPEHSIFAPDPWVFGLGFTDGRLVAEDPMAVARDGVCVGGPVYCPIASLGHPNTKGAIAYADAIQAAFATLA